MNKANQPRIWERAPEMARRVQADHERVELRGHHDYVHAFRVGEVARMVALDEWGDERVSELAGIAGMSHNADRILQKELGVGRKEVGPGHIRSLIESWGQGVLGSSEIEQVTHAVLGHDGVNTEHDSNILVALMDGDRVVNLDVDLFARSGQFYPNLPVVDYERFLSDPKATYRAPLSVFKDIDYSREWADPTTKVCVRTRLAKSMAATRVQLFDTFFATYLKQLAEEGMHPFPLQRDTSNA